MDIDIYQQCPSLSGKKIKFCCGKDIIADLNQILSKSNAGHGAAAVKQIDQVIEKSGNRDCLTTIKTRILISLGEIEQAEAINSAFLESHPNHLLGLQHQALIELGKGNLRDALDQFQLAMESIEGDSIPIAAANGFRILGAGLLQAGHLFAARTHFQFAQMLKGAPDEELQRLLYQTFVVPGVSILLKQDLRLDPPDLEDDANEWNKSYKNVIRLMDRGQFRKALKLLKRIDEKYPDQLKVVRGIAVMTSVNALTDQMAGAWRRLSRMPGLPDWDAVEYEAIAQLFELGPISGELDVVRLTYEVNDFERVAELAINSDRFAAMPEVPEDPFHEGPAPRHSFHVLSQPQLESADELDVAKMPLILGEMLIYGKQTDRPARLEFVATRNDRFANAVDFLRATFGEQISGEPREIVFGKTTEVVDCLTWDWHLPPSISYDKHLELVDENRTHALRDRWSKLQFSVLNGKSPREAASDDSLRIPLRALLLHLELSGEPQFLSSSATAIIRKELGIEEWDRIDPTEMKTPFISPVRQPYLLFEKLTDEQLLQLRMEALTVANIPVLRKLLPEVLRREHLDEVIPRDSNYAVLARIEPRNETALEYFKAARQYAKQQGRPFGTYLVQEFELRLSRGLTDKLDSLFKRIQMNHLHEPNVELHFSRILEQYGIVPRDGVPREPDTSKVESGPAEPANPIWTPEPSSSESAEATAPEKKSKLWLPGND